MTPAIVLSSLAKELEGIVLKGCGGLPLDTPDGWAEAIYRLTRWDPDLAKEYFCLSEGERRYVREVLIETLPRRADARSQNHPGEMGGKGDSWLADRPSGPCTPHPSGRYSFRPWGLLILLTVLVLAWALLCRVLPAARQYEREQKGQQRVLRFLMPKPISLTMRNGSRKRPVFEHLSRAKWTAHLLPANLKGHEMRTLMGTGRTRREAAAELQDRIDDLYRRLEDIHGT